MSSSALPNLACMFDILMSDNNEKHDTNHVEHIEHTNVTTSRLDLLCHEQVSVPKTKIELVLPLSQIIPKDFTAYYDREMYENEEDFLNAGRPRYTQRSLLDWEKNDIRSLLFVHKLDPQWEGQIPVVTEPGCRVVLLPLDASDSQAIAGLVESDIYKEHCVSQRDREAIARVAVEVARNGAPESEPLRLPEWRHMIENYLLNLGCEVQTRHDYRILVNQLKSAKKSSHGHGATLSVEERIAIWKSCQQSLYRRLHLDWIPDNL